MYRSHVISIVEDTPSKVNWNEIIEGLEFHAKKSQVIPYTSTSNRISCDDRNVLYLYLYLCCCLVGSCVQLFLRPHGLQPPRLLCPWDFLGKNTGVGWVAISFSRRFSWPRNRTCNFCIGRWFFTTESSRKPLLNTCIAIVKSNRVGFIFFLFVFTLVSVMVILLHIISLS